MTRREAAMVAEELYRLIRTDRTLMNRVSERIEDAIGEELVGTDEAARILGVSKNTLYARMSEVPHAKSGRKCVFRRSALLEYRNKQLQLL